MADADTTGPDHAGPQGAASEDAPHYLGHRQRLRARFLTARAEALQDYELLELLLFAAIPRRDVKPIAKQLLKEFGSLWQVVNAPPAALQRRGGLTETAAASIAIVAAVSARMHWQEVRAKPALTSWQRLIDYCERVMAHDMVEQLRLLFLDKRNQLIADEVQHRGTVDQTPAYPREIVKRALDLGACAIILVHNHPSGDPEPSRADIDLTRDVVKAATALGIAVHDHVIIGKGRHVSLKAKGLM